MDTTEVMATPRQHALAWVLALGAASTACIGTDRYNPGERLGTYAVTGKLSSTTCNPAPDPWTFDVKLNRQGDTIHWVQGSVPVSGLLQGSNVVLKTSALYEMRPPDAKKKLPGCQIVRTDTLDMSLTPDPAVENGVSAFSGTLSYSFAPTADSDCTDQLVASGGDMQTLPCELKYSLTGARTSTK